VKREIAGLPRIPVQNATSASSFISANPEKVLNASYLTWLSNSPLTINNRNGVETFAQRNSPSIAYRVIGYLPPKRGENAAYNGKDDHGESGEGCCIHFG
jgi:hypothetical protein